MSSILIHNATLIDGNGGAPIPDAAVLIQNGLIDTAGPMQSIKIPRDDVIRIDAAGGTILPGMIDMHAHVMHDGLDLDEASRWPFSYPFYRAIPGLKRLIDAGVTTVRDTGGADLGLKQAIDDGLVVGPRLHLSISMLSSTGGHADFEFRSGAVLPYGLPHPGRPTPIVDGPDEIRKRVRELIRLGADVIKICATGGVATPNDHPSDQSFSDEELESFVSEADNHLGRKVIAHAYGTRGIKAALRAGIHSIEHGSLLDDECIEIMVQDGRYLTPTLLVGVFGQTEESLQKPWMLAKGNDLSSHHWANMRKAYEAGVKIVMGTDSGMFPHGHNLRELSLLCKVGLSPMEAILAGTKVAAECLGWDDRIGTVEAGKEADIIVSRIDPLLEIEGMSDPENIALVVKAGRIYKNTIDP